MTKKISIALDILLQSPLHITSMEEGRYVPSEPRGRQVKRTSERVGIPLALTRELDIALAEPVRVGEGENSFMKTSTRIPVIPANGLGGRLRRAAAELIEDSLAARSLVITPRAYNTLSAGSPDASLLRSQAGMEQVIAGKLHPYFGVFGGSSYALSADLVVHEGYPVCTITEPFLSTPALVPAADRDFDMTTVIPLTKKDDIKDLRDPARLETVVGIPAVTGYIGDIMLGREGKQARKKDDNDQSKKTELSTIAALQAVTPGLHFALRFDLIVRSEAHLGLFLLALQRFCDAGQVGGKAAKGFGRFSVVHSRLYEHDQGGRVADGINLFERGQGGHYAFSDHPMMELAVNAGCAFVDDVDVAELEKFASADASKQFKTIKPVAE